MRRATHFTPAAWPARELVERFFKTYKRELISEYGPGVYREPVGDSSAAVPLSKYASSVGDC